MTDTSNTDPGGTLVLTAEDRDHLVRELSRTNDVLESMLHVERPNDPNASKRDGWRERYDTNARLIEQLAQLAA